MAKARVGLFFGSFNPVHIGHLILAEHLLTHSDLTEVWFVVTPHNPHKKKSSLLPDRERLHMVHLALEDEPRMRPCDIEFHLHQPNYTAQTLAVLREKYPTTAFSLLMGEDNLRTLHKWKNAESLMAEHRILVYPRFASDPFDPVSFPPEARIERVDAPRIEISATLIRQGFREGKPQRHLLPKAVFSYIDGSNLFQQ